MTIEKLITAYNEAIYDTDRERALRLIRDAVSNGVTPEEVVIDVLTPAMDQLVESISMVKDMNLAQYFIASQIAAEVTDEMISSFTQLPQTRGHVIIGTSQGDLHSLGKRIVMGCLKARMLGFTDLGVNVSPERFVEEAIAKNADVIAISSMMVHSARGENGCIRVRQLLKERGLDGRIKIIVGGAPYRFDPGLYKTVQADTWAADAITAGRVIADLVKESAQ